MNRKKFLQFFTGACAFTISALNASASLITKKRIEKGFKVDNGQDRNNKALALFQGDTFYTKVSANDTDNDLYIFESTRVKNGGPAEHFHYSQDEWWYILEGEFAFKIGEETFTAKKGDSVFGPKMIPHAFAKINKGKAKLLILYQPAGKMEAYFKAESEGASLKMNEEERKAFKKMHGFEVTGPALVFEKK